MFDTRDSAGRDLARILIGDRIQADIILGIPRGGVVVAAEIARRLSLPLNVLVVKKLGAPQNPELAIGAVTYDETVYIDSNLVSSLGVTVDYSRHELRRMNAELRARDMFLRQGRSLQELVRPRVILVDDGVATGATVRVAIDWLKAKGVESIILAVPVVPRETTKRLCALVDRCVILEEPRELRAVGEFFKDFHQVTDEEVLGVLKRFKSPT